MTSNLSLSPSLSSWCGPCKLLTPRLETLAGSRTGDFDLAKVDVDELDMVAGQYNVASIPSIFAIKNGTVVDQFVGSKDDDQLNAFVDGALKKWSKYPRFEIPFLTSLFNCLIAILLSLFADSNSSICAWIIWWICSC